MFDTREHVSEQAIDLRLISYFKIVSFGYMDRINVSNKMMKDCVRDKGDQRRFYKIVK